MRYFLVFSVLLLALTSAHGEEAVRRDGVYANLYTHSESRDGVSVSHSEFSLGYDRLADVERGLYWGVRVGTFNEQVLTSIPIGAIKSHPFLGVHGYKLFPVVSGLNLKAGAAVDFMTGDSNDPLYLYTGAEAGVRWNFIPSMYVEVPAELGIFPFFDGIPVIGKVGAQLGFNF